MPDSERPDTAGSPQPILFRCPNGHPVKVATSATGESVRCPHPGCNAVVVVPAAPGSAVVSAQLEPFAQAPPPAAPPAPDSPPNTAAQMMPGPGPRLVQTLLRAAVVCIPLALLLVTVLWVGGHSRQSTGSRRPSWIEVESRRSAGAETEFEDAAKTAMGILWAAGTVCVAMLAWQMRRSIPDWLVLAILSGGVAATPLAFLKVLPKRARQGRFLDIARCGVMIAASALMRCLRAIGPRRAMPLAFALTIGTLMLFPWMGEGHHWGGESYYTQWGTRLSVTSYSDLTARNEGRHTWDIIVSGLQFERVKCLDSGRPIEEQSAWRQAWMLRAFLACCYVVAPLMVVFVLWWRSPWVGRCYLVGAILILLALVMARVDEQQSGIEQATLRMFGDLWDFKGWAVISLGLLVESVIFGLSYPPSKGVRRWQVLCAGIATGLAAVVTYRYISSIRSEAIEVGLCSFLLNDGVWAGVLVGASILFVRRLRRSQPVTVWLEVVFWWLAVASGLALWAQASIPLSPFISSILRKAAEYGPSLLLLNAAVWAGILVGACILFVRLLRRNEPIPSWFKVVLSWLAVAWGLALWRRASIPLSPLGFSGAYTQSETLSFLAALACALFGGWSALETFCADRTDAQATGVPEPAADHDN